MAGTFDAPANPMLELVARLWARSASVNNFVEPDRNAERSHPPAKSSHLSASAWQRLFTARNSTNRHVRHLFAIQRFRSGTVRNPYNYCYYCVRCRWAFLVDGRGGVVAVDKDKRPLDGVVGAYRVETFKHGPCGAHWASSAVIDGGRAACNAEVESTARKAALTLVSSRKSAAQ
jgi:hypothetical protein